MFYILVLGIRRQGTIVCEWVVYMYCVCGEAFADFRSRVTTTKLHHELGNSIIINGEP